MRWCCFSSSSPHFFLVEARPRFRPSAVTLRMLTRRSRCPCQPRCVLVSLRVFAPGFFVFRASCGLWAGQTAQATACVIFGWLILFLFCFKPCAPCTLYAYVRRHSRRHPVLFLPWMKGSPLLPMLPVALSGVPDSPSRRLRVLFESRRGADRALGGDDDDDEFVL